MPRRVHGLLIAVLAIASVASAQPRRAEPVKPLPGAVKRAETALPQEVLQIAPPAPTGLTSTTDETVCAAHGGFGEGLGCHASLPLGELALVWDWKGPRAIDGFLVYRVDGGRHERVAQTPVNKSDYIFTEVAGNYAGRCYVVTAFQGPNESRPSATYCATDRDYLKTVVLWATKQATVERQVTKGTDPDADTTVRAGGLEVGFLYDTNKNGVLGDRSYVSVFRVALLFDTSRLQGRQIRAAQLKITIDSTWFWVKLAAFPAFAGQASDHVSSCAAKFAVGKDFWWERSDWIDAEVVSEPSPEPGPIDFVDVTPQVRGWVSTGLDNYGFVLEGSEENFDAFTEHGCLTRYSSVQLLVTYQ